MPSSKPQTAVTTQTNTPWAKSEPFLEDIMQEAQSQFDSRAGYQPWTGPTQAAQSWETQRGFHDASIQAQKGDALGQQAYGTAQGILGSEGLTGGMRGLLGNLSGMAAGGEADNPYLQSMIEASNRRIGDQVNSSMSGAGRYGSGAHTDVATRAMAEAANPILASAYESSKNRQLQANQLSSGIMDSGLNRVGATMQMAPGLYQNTFAPAERLMAVGGITDERAQNDLNAQIERWNLEQSRDPEALARYSGLIRGMGALGGSQVGTKPGVSTGQQFLSGAAAGGGLGAKIGGPFGGLLGAGAGGLLGMF